MATVRQDIRKMFGIPRKRQEPLRRCRHKKDYLYSSLDGRYGFWCEKIEPNDICPEDWRRKKHNCEHYEEL